MTDHRSGMEYWKYSRLCEPKKKVRPHLSGQEKRLTELSCEGSMSERLETRGAMCFFALFWVESQFDQEKKSGFLYSLNSLSSP